MKLLELDLAGLEIDGRWLVRRASITLRPGCLSVLVGPNGSGKTTLLKLLAGLWTPNEGEARLDGRSIAATPRKEIARSLGFVPQDTHLDFAFIVRDAVMMGRHPHIGRFQRESERDRRCVEEAMARADILHLADRLVTELSGGERQRVIIARSLATEAEAILLDEPTANLDIAHALDVLDLCRRLADDGKMIALATHDLNSAARYATQVVLLQSGLIVAKGTPAEVITDSAVHAVFDVRVERAISDSGETAFLFYRSAEAGESRQ